MNAPVIPRWKWWASQHHLRNTDTLSLTSRYSTDKIVTDFGIIGVSETKYGHDNFSNVAAVFTSGHVMYAMGWRSDRGRKFERLTNSEMGEVFVNLWDELAIDSFVKVVCYMMIPMWALDRQRTSWL